MKTIVIIYGSYETGLQKKAVEQLTEILLDYTFDYPVCMSFDECVDVSGFRCIYIGTKENNPYIQAHSTAELTHAEEYAITVRDDTVMIEGSDDRGVLYGCVDFYNKYIVRCEYPDTDRYWINPFERELPDYACSSYPSVKDRGLWTWGHVIYDYKGYIDHMVKLKMNTVIIWNDHVPVNAREMVDYAHACGIKLIWGFAWLWDTNCALQRIELSALEGFPKEIFAKYRKEYAATGADGIYFQTFTELDVDNIDGVLIADAATRFVNETAALFYEAYPDLEIQFGLHATSVKEKLDYIRNVDPRICIVWENCGSFPFSYIPKDVAGFEETKEFAKTIATLRGQEDRFGVVTKGLVKLDWTQFKHLEGSQHLGVSSRFVKDNRVTRKNRIWKYIQAYWLTHADKAQEMVQVMQRCKAGDLGVFALVEDGMFEENVMFPVALYGEMLWDCDADTKELISQVALRGYVDFA